MKPQKAFFILAFMLFLVFGVWLAQSTPGKDKQDQKDEQDLKDKQDQIDMLVDLGVLKFGQVDPSGNSEILILTKDNTGIFDHRNLNQSEGMKFEEILQNRGVIKVTQNEETGKSERHLMVFNPADKNTYAWIPFSNLKATREKIQKTRKTVLPQTSSQRTTDKNLMQMNFALSQ